MSFLVWGIIYLVLFVITMVVTVFRRKQKQREYIEDNNIIRAKVIGNVISSNGDETEHHAVLAYIVNDNMYKKECLNGYEKKIHEVGDIVNIRYNLENPEEIELMDVVKKVHNTPIEIILSIVLLLSGIIMIISGI